MEALLCGRVFLCGSTESGAVGGKMLNLGSEVVLVLIPAASCTCSVQTDKLHFWFIGNPLGLLY